MLDKNLISQFLLNELMDRQSRNPSYSLNKLALDIGVSRAQLSGVINRNRGLSLASAQKIVTAVNWSEQKKMVFVELVNYHFCRNQAGRDQAKKNLDKIKWDQFSVDSSLLGMWTASQRIGEKKTKPRFWNENTDTRIFIFESDSQFKITATSGAFFSSAWGHFELDGDELRTSSQKGFMTNNCPWADYHPKIAPTHEFQWINKNTFLLRSDSSQLTPKTLDGGEALVTLWERVSEI